MSATSDRTSRGPAYVNGSVTTIMIVLFMTLGLVTRQPPPPAIAEISPQAIEQITDPPEEQAVEFGEEAVSGEGPPGQVEGGDGPGLVAPSEPEVEEPTEDPTPPTRRCVGSPPRQIADPQSPPCVPFWQGDNGGATHQGVTPTEIRVAVPGTGTYYLQAWANFFNKRFEFYGRKLKFILIGENTMVEAEQRARATAADEVHQVFASLSSETFGGDFYGDELIKRGIIYVAATPFYGEKQMQAAHPYLWQYPMAADQLMGAAGEWWCKRLADGVAEHAGEAGPYREAQRKLGVAILDMPDARQDESLLVRELGRCGVEAQIEHIDIASGDTGKTAAILKFKQADVTSVLCVCVSPDYGSMRRLAVDQAYYPEWLGTTFWNNDVTWGGESPPAEGTALTFGLTSTPPFVPLVSEPYRWAALEGDPATAPGAGDDQPLGRMANIKMYKTMLLLASGIQLAGPNLTPETFAAGLQRATFPNPEHPNQAGKVGFEGGTHSMTKEVAEFWWTFDQAGPDMSAAPTPCYFPGAAHYRLGTMPSGRAGFFTSPCSFPAGGENEQP